MREFLYNRIEALKEYIQITLKLTSFPNIPVIISKDNETITLVPDSSGQVKTTLPSIGEWHLTTTYQDHIINKTLNCPTLGLIYKVDMTKFCALTIEGDPDNEIEITNGIFTYKSEVNKDGLCIMEIGVGDWEITSKNQNFSISDTITVTFDDVELAKTLKMPRVNVITDVGNIITISNDANQLSGFANENGEFSTLIGLGSYVITMSNGIINQSQSIIIDEINKDYEVRMAFPTIAVTTNPGNTITLTDGVQTVRGAADINGIYITQVGFGTWSAISSTGELSLAATELVIVNEYSKNYEVTILLPTITVTTDPGNIVTITSNKTSNGGTADENGICVLQALIGEWEIKTALPSNENIYVIDNINVNNKNEEISIFLPSITVHSNAKAGTSVSAESNGIIVQGTINEDENCVLKVGIGFWTVSIRGEYIQSNTVSITAHSTNIELEFLFMNKWQILQQKVRNGTIKNDYRIGDQLTIKYNGVDTLWDIVAFDIAIPTDSTKTHSMTLMPHGCLEKGMKYDEKEPSNSDSSRLRYGNNRYIYSNIHQWLNSSEEANNWYTAQHSADNAPPYTNKSGFKTYFEQDFLNVLGTTKIKTVKASVDGGGYDIINCIFYLPSASEIGGTNETGIEEGSLFPYFNDADRRKKYYNNSAVDWWIRTPKTTSSYLGRYSTSTGIAGIGQTKSAYYAQNMGIAPVCNII